MRGRRRSRWVSSGQQLRLPDTCEGFIEQPAGLHPTLGLRNFTTSVFVGCRLLRVSGCTLFTGVVDELHASDFLSLSKMLGTRRLTHAGNILDLWKLL
jgi:hypothetical protein